jgi:hypothetical protein
MKILDKLANLDRRIIYLLVGLAVIIPMLIPLGLPVDITRPVKNVYDKIEFLPAGSIVLVSTDYDPGSEAELYPATEAVIEHCFRRNLRIYMMGLWPAGSALGERALDTLARIHHKTYGIDFVNVGYRPGGAVMLLSLGRSFRDVIRVDFTGRPIDSLELGRQVRSSRDIALVMTLSAGDPGVIHWVQYFHARFGTPICAATTAIMAPRQYPYMNSGQLVGLLGGLKGAAEYETLIKRRGRGLTGMDSQSIVHVLLVLFIILGNLILINQRRKRSAAEAS